MFGADLRYSPIGMKKAAFNAVVGPIVHKRMAAVRRSGTGPELTVQKILDGLSVVYRTSERDLAGTPDLCPWLFLS